MILYLLFSIYEKNGDINIYANIKKKMPIIISMDSFIKKLTSTDNSFITKYIKNY